MTLFGNRDQYSDAPKNAVNDKANTGQEQYGNTVFGVDDVEVTVNGDVAHSGWVQRIVGYGPLTEIEIVTAGSGYANSDTVLIEATDPDNGVNAAANVVTDGNGAITSVVVSEYGQGFTGSESLAITTSGGSSANLVPTFGGRSGRVHYETLVAGSIQFDATDFANTDSGAVANSTGDADDAIFPDS